MTTHFIMSLDTVIIKLLSFKRLTSFIAIIYISNLKKKALDRKESNAVHKEYKFGDIFDLQYIILDYSIQHYKQKHLPLLVRLLFLRLFPSFKGLLLSRPSNFDSRFKSVLTKLDRSVLSLYICL